MSTSIIKAVQKRTKGFYRSYFMKSSWCDTDGRKDRGKWCWKVLQTRRADCLNKAEGRNGIGYDMSRIKSGEEAKRETDDVRVGGKGHEGKSSIHDSRVILTVGHTLILDLQVFVGSWAGVWEDI